MASGQYSPKIGGLLERIAEYPNIPRKKAKFEVLFDLALNIVS